MRAAMTWCVSLVTVGVLVMTSWLRMPWESVATTGLVIMSLAWLALVLTLPWNLYFQAKSVRFEMQRARERGIAVRVDREAEAARVQQRMLRFSIALHIGSAALAAVVTAASSGRWGRWGYLFSGAYLLSGLFRPGVEYYRYLRQRLGHLAAETRFPREDVKALSAEVASLRAQAVASAKADKQLHEDLDKLRQGTAARQAEIERRFVLLTRTFEETVDRLTDNQQIIGGIKAFLRLVQKGGDVARVGSEGGAPGGA
jgi:hypothetical protein